MRNLVFLSFVMTLALAQSPRAATTDLSQMPNISTDHFTVAADASYDEVYEIIRPIRDQTALQNATTYAYPFIASLQHAEIQEADVIKPDGHKVPVGQDHITVRDAPGTNGFADFGDNKLLQVLFPGVEVGDRIYVRMKLHSQALFPGRFSEVDEPAPEGYPYQSTMIVDAPVSLGLVGKAWGMPTLKQQTTGDRVTFTITQRRDAYVSPDPYSVSPLDYAGAADISNFRDWADMARAYRERAADKATVTPEIRTLAQQLTAGKTGREAVDALDRWVRMNIRYVQVYLDAGGYVPHPAASILSNRYGDCKDYVTLTQALLKAVGIDSEPVLVDVIPMYRELPLPGPEQFDHAILYVPSLKLYLNPTDRFAPEGDEAGSLSGKPVLHTTSGDLRRFPVLAAADNVYEQTTDESLLPDGSIQGKTKVNVRGSQSSSIRNALAAITPEHAAQIVQSLLAKRGEPGTGTLTTAPNFTTDHDGVVKATWKSPQLVTMDDVVTLKMPVGFTPFDLGGLLSTVSTDLRQSPEMILAQTLRKSFTLHLPVGYRVSHVPRDVHHEDSVAKYDVTYRTSGQDITAVQEVVIRKDVIAPGEYQAFKADLTAAVKAIQATLILEKTNG